MSMSLVHPRKSIIRGSAGITASHILGGIFVVPAREAWTTVRTWQRRYEMRRHLLRLDDRLLDDMGMSRGDAMAEAAKPFWRG